MADTGSRITRLYGNFRGIDLRGEECALTRSPDCKNVWRNYKELASIETRPGLELLYKFDIPIEYNWEEIYRILFFKDKLIAITNYGMYTTNKRGEFDEIYKNNYEYNKINFVFEFGDFLYFAGAGYYYRYDGTEVEKVEPYIPTTSIGRTPAGEGTAYEGVNLLTPTRHNTFTSDGEAKEYYVDVPGGILSNPAPTVYNMETNEYITDVLVNGNLFSFSNPPPKSSTGGDNIRITFAAGDEYNNYKITTCSCAQVFDNRAFVGGGKEIPNRLWYSKLKEPTYFSDVDYYDEGADIAKISGMVPGNNALWVFREPSDSNTNIFYHVPVVDDDYGKVYPSSHSSVSLACVGSAINFNDDIVFFSPAGMEGISSDITTEQFASHRSSVVDRLMTCHKDYKDMLLAEWQGYLLVIMGKDVYLADSRAVYQNESHMEYEWYYWDLGVNVVAATVHDGILYVATDECEIYSLTDTSPERAIESYWTTPKDKFNTPQKTKTTNKRGCVVEGHGDIKVYAKTEGMDEWDEVGGWTDVEDYIAPRIKQKKFKDLQLKFESKTSFKLESVTIEAVVGGYIKR